MCGIAGFYGFRDDKLIKKISKELRHRGPDGEGYYLTDSVTLLSRRLAIIDRKGGDQPIYNEDKSIVVVYNGEIYNYRELRPALEAAGHTFKTHSDTEIIVHGYEEWGERAFDRYNGMFAIALYDSDKKRLILARDHFGIKPLYYSFLPNQKFIFSSEIRPIIQSQLVKTYPNDRVIYRYLRYRIHDDTEETFFMNVKKLCPGQMLIVDPGGFKIQSYTNIIKDLQKSPLAKDIDESIIKEFENRLIKAVKYRLISEVPVGTCLSGGLDSSTVVSIVNKLRNENVEEASSVGEAQKTFSAVFPGSSNDEESYINLVLQKSKKIASFKTQPKAEDFFHKDIEEFIKTQEEPTISTGPYAQYKVMQLAHKKVTVLLDGQGSDEMMAGYDPYLFVYLRQLYSKKEYGRFIKELFYSLDILKGYLYRKVKSSLGFTKDPDPALLLNESFVKKYGQESFPIIQNNLRRRLVEDIFSNSLPALLRYEDKNAMKYSIEGRVPFLDYELMRFLFSLPDEAIIKNGVNKYILRQSMKKILPEEIAKRRNKIGFTTPEQEWFMKMKNWIYSIFLSEPFSKRKYFDQKEVLNAFEEFIQGKNDDTMLFWRILNIELWLRLFFDKNKDIGKERLSGERPGGPNKDKKTERRIDGRKYLRIPVRTDLFIKGDDYASKIANELMKFLKNRDLPPPVYDNLSKKNWFLAVSEKIVAISQGRSYFIWDIKPTLIAKFLSRYVRKTPYGIGLGSPWTMQIAIEEVGLPRILFASIVASLTKPLGIKGLFYHLAGREVASIDGPTEYSLYPSNVSAKLGPKDPKEAALRIDAKIRNIFPSSRDNFLGVAVIDANDLGQNTLGNTTKISDKIVEQVFRDNPMGQANEQTPLVLVTIEGNAV